MKSLYAGLAIGSVIAFVFTRAKYKSERKQLDDIYATAKKRSEAFKDKKDA